MRKISTLILSALLGTTVLQAANADWIAFSGGTYSDVQKTVVDGNGNVYIVGNAADDWGTPVRAFLGGGQDVYVAKYNSSGVLLWNTFLGSANYDGASGIAVDANGNVYATGFSMETWGETVGRAFNAGNNEGFVAKLNTNGVLQWTSFVGSADMDQANDVCVNAAGEVFVSGYSYAAWAETPVRAHVTTAFNNDGFVAKLNSNGTLAWHTFLGGPYSDQCNRLIADAAGNVYVVGYSSGDWEEPNALRAYTSGYDGWLTKLNSTGAMVWFTYQGGTATDYANNLTFDKTGNVVVCGISEATWGTPVVDVAGSRDVFVAKYTTAGALSWNTFYGGTLADNGNAVGADANDNIYVAGHSAGTWGTPVNAYVGGRDLAVVKLTSTGALTWNTFLGTTKNENGYGIAVNTEGVYVAGYGNATIGNPVKAYTSGTEGLLVRFTTAGAVDVTTVTGLSNTTCEISIYPSLVSDQLTVRGVQTGKITLFDMSGRAVASGVLNGETSINVASLAKGVYSARITTPSGSLIQKLIKK